MASDAQQQVSVTLQGGGGGGGGTGTGTYTVTSPVLTTGVGTSGMWTTYSNPLSNSTTWSNVTYAPSPAVHLDNGRINLEGANSDLILDGVSVRDTLAKIEQRLNILRPNAELEAKWDQLRELGEQYRQLEAEIMEKQAMWDKLQHMPDPVQSP